MPRTKNKRLTRLDYYRNREAPYIPTPEQIASACEAIRATHNQAQRTRAGEGPADPVEIPVVPLRDFLGDVK